MFKNTKEFIDANPDMFDNEDVAILEFKRGVIALKAPTMTASRKFASQKKLAGEDEDLMFSATMTFIKGCVLSPSSEEFDAFIDKHPLVLSTINDALVALSEASCELVKKA